MNVPSRETSPLAPNTEGDEQMSEISPDATTTGARPPAAERQGSVLSFLCDPPKRGWAHGRRFYLILIAGTVTCTVVGIVLLGQPGGPFPNSYNGSASLSGAQKAETYLALVAILGWLGLCFAIFNRVFGGVFERAFRSVPGPEEIHSQLWSELGREPTLEEVLSVQRYLDTNRNEAMIGAGALLVGSRYAANRASGKPGLF